MSDNLYDSCDYSKSITTEIADGSLVNTEGEGIIGRTKISYTPSFTQNILAINSLTDLDEVVVFSKRHGGFTVKESNFDFNVQKEKEMIRINEMYYINLNDLRDKKERQPKPIKNVTLASTANTHPTGSIILWHQRLHLSNNYIKRLSQLNLVKGLTINDYDMKRQLAVCESCMYSKFTRNSFFKRYQVERNDRKKIAKIDQKAFKLMKDTQPFSTNSEKFQKYPDQPNSEFEEYSKDEIEIVDTESKFIKTKYNGLQNNLVGEIYQHISVDLKGPFNIPGFHN
jgi:hypothetical protein